MPKKETVKLSVVIIGHVDSGKSTTCGCLMAKLGKVDPRLLEKYKKEATQLGKGSFSYAWVTDKLDSERKRGITISSTVSTFETKNRNVTIIDAPGHKDFIKNMISGTSQADVAILMVSAAKGEFETGIGTHGQTREHAILANTLGIKAVIVAVNKMDTTVDGDSKPYDKKRFDEISDFMVDFLTKLGFKKANVYVVPICGFKGENLVDKSARAPWYKGVSLADTIDKCPVPKRPFHKPLRMPLTAVYKIGGIGTVACGKVETGEIKAGVMVAIQPGDQVTECKSVEMHHVSVDKAGPGDNIGVNVKIPKDKLKEGMVLGDSKNDPPQVAYNFTAKIIINNHKGEIKPGYSPVIHIHATHVTCRIVQLSDSFDRKTGKALEKKPLFIKKGQGAVAVFKPTKRLVVEQFKKYAALGRFSIRDSNQTIGVGLVTKVDNDISNE